MLRRIGYNAMFYEKKKEVCEEIAHEPENDFDRPR